MEKKKQKVHIVGIALTFTSWGILLGAVHKYLLNFRDKISFFYQELIFREIRDLEIGKSTDKYLFYVFSAFIYLSITNFPYAVGLEVAIGRAGLGRANSGPGQNRAGPKLARFFRAKILIAQPVLKTGPVGPNSLFKTK